MLNFKGFFFCTKPTAKVPSKLRRVLFYEVVDAVAELWFNFPKTICQSCGDVSSK